MPYARTAGMDVFPKQFTKVDTLRADVADLGQT